MYTKIQIKVCIFKDESILNRPGLESRQSRKRLFFHRKISNSLKFNICYWKKIPLHEMEVNTEISNSVWIYDILQFFYITLNRCL